MASKKINIFFKNLKRKPYYQKNLESIKDEFSLIDLQHDLNNQITKISQKLEFLQSKVTTSGSIRRKYEEICNKYPDDVSEALTFIDRVTNQMSSEMVCMNVLSGNNLEAYNSKQEHKIYKVIHRLLMLYENDFNERGIKYNISPSNLKWRVNHDVLSAILLKIIQNATKYCLHDSEIDISITDNQIIIRMLSLRIYNDELEKLFENGYKGRNGLKSGKSKTGKGLYHAKKLSDFHNFKLSINTGSTVVIGRNGLEYSTNIFIISMV